MADVQDLYREHYGMDGRPFGVLADAQLSYAGPRVVQAHAAMEYGILTGAPVMVLTGDPGTGKTSLVLRLMEEADTALRMVLLCGMRQAGGSVLPWILQALGETGAASLPDTEQFTRLQDLLIAEYAAGRRMVLIVDEAQSLSDLALDELRLLSNINTARDQLLQVLLVGHSALRDRLRQPDMQGLAQRVGIWAAMPPLAPEEMEAYVGARLARMGGPEDLFEPEALALVHAVTAGLPRAINQLCEMALIFGLTDKAGTVGADAVRTALDRGMFLAPLPMAGDHAGHTAPPRRLRLASGA